MSTYKRRRRAGSLDRRIEAAVQLRAEGLSLREIAGRLKVSHDTVWRDLAKGTDIRAFILANHDRRLADAKSELAFARKWCTANHHELAEIYSSVGLKPPAAP